MASDPSSSSLQDLHAEWLLDPEYRAAFELADRAIAIGDQVGQLRIEAGMTQHQLAHASGTSRAAIARLESGDGDPRLFTLRRVGLALGGESVIGLRKQAVA